MCIECLDLCNEIIDGVRAGRLSGIAWQAAVTSALVPWSACGQVARPNGPRWLPGLTG